MNWICVSDVIPNRPERKQIISLVKLVSQTVTMLDGPRARAYVAGGCVADLLAEGLGMPWSPPRDIDVFVTYHPKLIDALCKAGMKYIPSSDPHLVNLKPWGCKNMTWDGSKLPVDLVLVKDVGQKVYDFDLYNRLAWCDGQEFWTTRQAMESITNNIIKLRNLRTPESTAYRAYKFSKRYGAKIEAMTRDMLIRAIAEEPREFVRAIKEAGYLENQYDEYNITACFFKPYKFIRTSKGDR